MDAGGRHVLGFAEHVIRGRFAIIMPIRHLCTGLILRPILQFEPVLGPIFEPP